MKKVTTMAKASLADLAESMHRASNKPLAVFGSERSIAKKTKIALSVFHLIQGTKL